MIFTPASEYTKHCFNRYGIKHYDAITECTVKETGFVSYDLTVLDFKGHYQSAHGSIIHPVKFETIEQAEQWLNVWYSENKQQAAFKVVK
jgi:hypothetical protein